LIQDATSQTYIIFFDKGHCFVQDTCRAQSHGKDLHLGEKKYERCHFLFFFFLKKGGLRRKGDKEE
jgi:hypothetical protein